MNKETIKDDIRIFYADEDASRLKFILEELSHAWVNIFREKFRKFGAPDAPAGERNCADNLSMAIAILIPFSILAILVVI